MAPVQGDRWAVELGERIARARRQVRLTQQALADQAKVSKVYISKLERGMVGRPGLRKLQGIADVLGAEVIPPLPEPEAVTPPGSRSFNVVGRVEEARLVEVRRLPVYRWGSAGDPRDARSSPDPDHEEFPPPGRESLIGPNGFGVVVKGESMARHDIHDGDVVWINPDRPYRIGRPVLAQLWTRDGDAIGMVIKTVIQTEQGDQLWSEPDDRGERGPVACARFDVIGPVVGISPAFRVPS